MGLNTGCRGKEIGLANGMSAIEMENEWLRIVILPDKGMDIYSIQYKPLQDLDVLWKSPWGLTRPGSRLLGGKDSKQQWLDYHGGWQLMLPNAGNECAYKGASHTFHGEASIVPWTVNRMTDGADGSITLHGSVRLTRSPLFVEREVRLAPDLPVIQIKEKVTNAGSDAFDLLWGHHIVYGAPFLSNDCVLHIPAKTATSAIHNGLSGERLESGASYSWPFVHRNGKTIDFSRLPAEPASDLAFLELEAGWYVLSNPAIGLRAGVAWDLDVMSYMWLWQEFRGTREYPFFGNCYVMGMEPCTAGTADGLVESAKRGQCLSIPPGDCAELNLCMTLFTESKQVSHISPAGQISVYER